MAHISKVKYLGYSFYRYKGRCRLRVHPKSVTKIKDKIKELTDRNNGMSNADREEKYQQYARWCERSANQLMISILLDYRENAKENRYYEKIP